MMENREDDEKDRGSNRQTQRDRKRESVLNDHFSSLEAVIYLASGLQVM